MPWVVEENMLEQEETSGAWMIERIVHIYTLPLRYGLEIGPKAILAALVRYASEFTPHEGATLKVLEPGSRLRVLSPVSDDQYPNAPTHTLWWHEPRVIEAAVLELRASGEMPSSGSDPRSLDEEQIDELNEAWSTAYGTVTSSLGRRRPRVQEAGTAQSKWMQEEFDRTLAQLLRAWRSLHGEPSGSGLRGHSTQSSHPTTQRRGLSAAPGDVEGFVREVSEAAIAAIEDAFRRAGDERNDRPLRVAGKPLEARAPMSMATAQLVAGNYRDLSVEDAFLSGAYEAHAYAWIARQFVRGATGHGVISLMGVEVENVPAGWENTLRGQMHFSTPEARLGLDVWRIGRNVAAEVEREWRDGAIQSLSDRKKRKITAQFDLGRGRTAHLWRARFRDLVLESVRTRLNWPNTGDFDPPPPAQWPDGDS